MEKIILSIIISIFLLGLVGAPQEGLGTFKGGDCVNLIQTCSNCTYNNISAILYPNSSVALSNVAMTKDDTYYNYTFCDDSTLGNYVVNGYGDLDGIKTVWGYNFELTSTGLDPKSILNNSTMIILLALAIILLITGAATNFSSIGFIGSILLILVGIYTMIYGLNDVVSLYTQAVALVEIGLGIIFMFISAYEWLPWGKE